MYKSSTLKASWAITTTWISRATMLEGWLWSLPLGWKNVCHNCGLLFPLAWSLPVRKTWLTKCSTCDQNAFWHHKGACVWQRATICLQRVQTLQISMAIWAHHKQSSLPQIKWTGRVHSQSSEAAYKKVPPLQSRHPERISDTSKHANQVRSVPCPATIRLHP